MTAENNQHKCKCGLSMMPTQGAPEIRHCLNCDSVQPQQRASRARRVTKDDIRFDMYWLRVMNTEYKNNTKNGPQVGSANSDGDGDTPPTDKGETHE